MRLLIADDEENLAQALKAVLEDAGYTCDVCFDGIVQFVLFLKKFMMD